MKNSEAELHENICNYIRLQYPNVLFNSDMAGVKLTMRQAIKAKQLRSQNGFPDLVLYEPRSCFRGLFLELKREGEVLYKKDKITLKTEHLQTQLNTILKLRSRGYGAYFAIGFDEAKHLIDVYLAL